MSSNNSTDTPTVFAHPGMRIAYSVVSLVILWITLTPGNSLFVGFMMLAWGLFMDYVKFNPVTAVRKKVRAFGCVWSGILIVFNLLACFGMLNVEKVTNTKELYLTVTNFPFFVDDQFPVKWFWLVVAAVTVILTVVDWLTEQRELELVLTSTTGTNEIAVAKEVKKEDPA